MNTVLAVVVIALLILTLLGLLGIGLITNGQSRENRERDRRLTMLEARVNTLPTHSDLTALRNDISGVVSTCAEIDGRTEAMAQTLRTIQDHLLGSH